MAPPSPNCSASGRAGLDTQLCSMLQATCCARPAGGHRASTTRLGHQGSRCLHDALRRVKTARQHQVDDVSGEFDIAVGDEYLGAGDAVGAVANQLRWLYSSRSGRPASSIRFMVAQSSRPSSMEPSARCAQFEPAVSASTAPLTRRNRRRRQVGGVVVSEQGAPRRRAGHGARRIRPGASCLASRLAYWRKACLKPGEW